MAKRSTSPKIRMNDTGEATITLNRLPGTGGVTGTRRSSESHVPGDRSRHIPCRGYGSDVKNVQLQPITVSAPSMTVRCSVSHAPEEPKRTHACRIDRRFHDHVACSPRWLCRSRDTKSGARKRRELRYALREIRNAIDKYKDMSDMGKLGNQQKVGTRGLPGIARSPRGRREGAGEVDKKIRFLRRIPRDPFTNSKEWGKRSTQDDPTSTSWGGQNVFDVYSKTTEKTKDGTPYSDW